MAHMRPSIAIVLLMMTAPTAVAAPGTPIFTIYALPTTTAVPTSIVAGPDGNVWFTENTAPKIGRSTTAGVITEFPTSGNPTSITVGQDGNLWFTESLGSVNQVGRMTVSGTLTEFVLPASVTTPNWITPGPDGNLWFTTCGTIGRMTTTGTLTTFALPSAPAWCAGAITAGPDGNLWFTEAFFTGPPIINANGRVGHITPTGTITESPDLFGKLPVGSIVTGPDGNLWFPTFGGLLETTTSGVISTVPLASGADPALLGPGLVTAPDGSVWFTEGPGGKVGRIGTDRTLTEFALPTANCFPFPSHSSVSGVTLGPGGNIWFTARTCGRGQVGLAQSNPNPRGSSALLWGNTATGDVSVWQMDGAMIRAEAFLAPTVPLTWQIVGVGDLDADGSLDLIWRNFQTGDVAVWFLSATTVIRTAIVASEVSLAWQIDAVADLDGDGRADFVWRQTQTGDVAVWLMNGALVKQSSGLAIGVPLAWQIVGIGDVDGDGKKDLVWRQTQSGDVAIWLLNGASIKQVPPTLSAGVPLAWQIAGVGDLDGDGKADLLWRHTQTGDVAVWLLNGNMVSESAVIATAPLEWVIAFMRDLNADGMADIVWRHTSTEIAVWLMNGTTTTEALVLGSTVWQVH